MIAITLPDGTVKEVSEGTTSLDVATSISEGLARNVLAAEVNGEVWDPTRPFTGDSTSSFSRRVTTRACPRCGTARPT